MLARSSWPMLPTTVFTQRECACVSAWQQLQQSSPSLLKRKETKYIYLKKKRRGDQSVHDTVYLDLPFLLCGTTGRTAVSTHAYALSVEAVEESTGGGDGGGGVNTQAPRTNSPAAAAAVLSGSTSETDRDLFRPPYICTYTQTRVCMCRQNDTFSLSTSNQCGPGSIGPACRARWLYY